MQWAIEQIVGPERRERVSHQTWCGEGGMNSRRPVNSGVRRLPTYERSAAQVGQRYTLGMTSALRDDANDPNQHSATRRTHDATLADSHSYEGVRRYRAVAVGARASGAMAVGSFAIGALAVGAAAIGALAIGRLAVKRLLVQRSRFDRLEINDLSVRRLQVEEVILTKRIVMPDEDASGAR